jgi:hypothetical protein
MEREREKATGRGGADLWHGWCRVGKTSAVAHGTAQVGRPIQCVPHNPPPHKKEDE